MNAMKKTLVYTFLAVGAAFCVTPSAQAGKYVGKAFPNFTATDPVTGEKFALKDLRGKVVLIDFWATWCGPCVRELPNVKRTYKKYKEQGFEIVSISLDSDRRRFKSFVSRQRNGLVSRHGRRRLENAAGKEIQHPFNPGDVLN